MKLYDVIIIGGGPAGLNAAVVLGRCRRNVLLFDTGNQRNRSSHAMHNYLTRDDIIPSEFLKLSHQELDKYGVHTKNIEITKAKKNSDGSFSLLDKNGNSYACRKLLLATGLTDKIPNLKNIEDFYGNSIFHCPYCDGWEVREKKIGVYARNKNGFELALLLLSWSSSVIYFNDGGHKLKPGQPEKLKEKGIIVINRPIKSLEGCGGRLRNIILNNDEEVPTEALFFVNGYYQQSDLIEELGCTFNSKKVVSTNRFQQTNIPGVYVAGDASRDMHFVVVAAAEGAKAGVIINKELLQEDHMT